MQKIYLPNSSLEREVEEEETLSDFHLGTKREGLSSDAKDKMRSSLTMLRWKISTTVKQYGLIWRRTSLAVYVKGECVRISRSGD